MQQMFMSATKRDEARLVTMGSLETTKILSLGKAEQFQGVCVEVSLKSLRKL